MSHLVRARASMSAQLAFSLQWRKMPNREPAHSAPVTRGIALASDEEKVSDLHLFHLGLRPGLKSHSQSDLASSSLGRARISSLGTDAQTADLAMSTNVNIFRRLHVCSEMSTGMLRQMRENKTTPADQSRQIRKVARSLELIINYRAKIS